MSGNLNYPSSNPCDINPLPMADDHGTRSNKKSRGTQGSRMSDKIASPVEIGLKRLDSLTDDDGLWEKIGSRSNAVDVPRFLIVGMPACGKSELARRLCIIWGCESVTPTNIIKQHLRNKTHVGSIMMDALLCGCDLEDTFVTELVKKHLYSRECQEKGYILEDIPNNSEKSITIEMQMKLLAELVPPLNCIINITPKKDENRTCWEQKRIDPVTGMLIFIDTLETSGIGPCPGSPVIDITQGNEIHLQQMGDKTKEIMLNDRILIRPEEFPENLDKHFNFYKTIMKPVLDRIFHMMPHIPVIHVQYNKDPSKMFKETMASLYLLSNRRELQMLDLFGDWTILDALAKREPSKDIEDDSLMSCWKGLTCRPTPVKQHKNY